MSLEPDPIETVIGTKAYNETKSLELGMSKGLGELGYVWQDILNMPKLEKLKLVYYHGDHISWVKEAGKLMAAVMYDSSAVQALDGELEMKIEMYQSVDVPDWPAATYTKKTDEYMKRAKSRMQVYSFSLPPKLSSITITASVAPQGSFAFATYRHGGWRFNTPAGRNTDTHLRKTLVWEKEHRELQDTAL